MRVSPNAALSSMSVAKAEIHNSIMDGTTILIASMFYPAMALAIRTTQQLSHAKTDFFYAYPYCQQLVFFVFVVLFPLLHYVKKDHLRTKVLGHVSNSWTLFIDCKS